MYSKILIPLDGSQTAAKVLPYARYLAGKLKLAVELLAVIDIAEMAGHISAEKARHLDTLIEDGVRTSEGYLRKVAGSFSASAVKSTVEKGRAEEVIIEKGETDPGLLITMATHGRSGLNRFLLGSVAEKVLRGAANPLLIVRATEEAKAEGEVGFKSLIVPLDGSELAESVLPTVAEVAKALGLEVTLFRAYHIPYNAYAGDDGFYAVNYDELIGSVRDEANEYLEHQAAAVKKLGVDKVSVLSKEGFAGDEIIALGRKTPGGLIAMCSHGRSGVKRFVLGSVTENVVRHTTNPVLVVRAR
ncbi:MAG TPA: universal stress protein [Terriglobales bacterium]|jgi:nucleotide-binding universal stress UspA family protein|nr:universal stress protein [Terriglobales bacterium]